MSNAASTMISRTGRASAPPKKMSSSRTDRSADFLQSVKKAVDSRQQDPTPAGAADQKQDLLDDDKKADQIDRPSKDSKDSKDLSKQTDGVQALEAALAQGAAPVSGQLQNQQIPSPVGMSQQQGQTKEQAVSSSALTGVSSPQTEKEQQVVPLSTKNASQALSTGTAQKGGNQEKAVYLDGFSSSHQNAAASLKTEEQGRGAENPVQQKTEQPQGKVLEDQPKASLQTSAPEGEKTKRGGAETTLRAETENAGKTAERPSTDSLTENQGGLPVQLQGMSQDGTGASDLVKVRVGEGPLDPGSGQFPQDVAKTVLHRFQDGKNEFDIQLTPKELGTIHIQMVFDRGTASILMHCTDPKTQNLLSLNSEQIRSIVQGETGLHTTVQLKDDPSSQNGRQDFDGRGQNPQRDAQRQEQQRRNQLDQELFSQQFRMEFQRTGTMDRFGKEVI